MARRGSLAGIAAAALLAASAAPACGPRRPPGLPPDAPDPAFAGIEPFADAPVLLRERASVRIDPHSRSLRGEATLTIRDDGRQEFPIVFDAHVPGIGGFHVDALTQDGTPCRFAVYGRPSKVMVVRVPAPAKEITLRLQWSGSSSPAGGQGYLLADEVLLLDVQGWLPFLPATDADWSLTVSWPKDFDLLLEGSPSKPSPAKRDPGFLTSTTSFHSASSSTVFARPKYVTRSITVAGQPVLLAVPPANADALPRLEKNVRAAMAALAPLGPLPPGGLRIVESTMTMALLEAFGGRTFVAFRPDEPDVSLLAHEIAHSFFGGTIFPTEVQGDLFGRKAARTELWPESLAEYAASWSLDPDALRERRAAWEAAYARGLGEEVFLGRTAASYTRAPLLLCGMESRVGRKKMQSALATLVREETGKRIGWDAVARALAETAGRKEGDRFLDWIHHPGSPDLRLDRIEIADSALSASLVQTADPPYRGEIELAFVAAPMEEALRVPQAKLAVTTIAFASDSTDVRLPIPHGAKTLLVDPDVFVPRAIEDPGAPGVLAVPLDRPLPHPRSTWFLKPPEH